MNPDEQTGEASAFPPEASADLGVVPVSAEQQLTFNGPLTTEQLLWVGIGLLVLLILLAIRDAFLARKKWIVPFLLILRTIACAGVLLALAAPSTTTRRTFETRRGLGVYLDTSASMSLRDPADGNGHLARWNQALRNAQANRNSTLAALDVAAARVKVALALLAAAGREDRETRVTLGLLSDQIRNVIDTLTHHESRIPYPDLAGEVRESLTLTDQSQVAALLRKLPADEKDNKGRARNQTFQDQLEALRQDVDESLKRLAVISRELARREERTLKKGDGQAEGPTRLEYSQALLRQVEERSIAPASGDLDVIRAGFAARPKTGDEKWNVTGDLFPEQQPAGEDSEESPAPTTDLNALLDEIVRQRREGRIDAAVLITDAVHNADGKPFEIPPGLENFPLLLVPAGGDYKRDDVTLWRASAPKTLMKGDFLSVDCLVGARGYPGQTTRLRLMENGEQLDSVEVTFGEDGGDQQVRLTAQINSAGSRRYDVEVVPLPGELRAENNLESINVDIFTGDLTVLLVDSWPRWEMRYLSNLLKRDDTTQHQEIMFAPDPPDPLPDTLADSDRLSAFHIVVLGDIGPDILGPLEIQALEEYVSDGGNLIVLAGQEFMPGAFEGSALAEILPVRLDLQRSTKIDRVRLAPTPAGRRIAALSLEDDSVQNNAVWSLGSTLLPLTRMSHYNVPKPSAQVILEARPIAPDEPAAGDEANPAPEETADGNSGIPYIVWHRYGGGRVFYLPSPTTYFLRYRFGDRYHYRFWGQFLRWTTMAEMHGGNALVQISPSAKRYREGEIPRVDVELRDLEGNPVAGAEVAVQLERAGAETTLHRSVAVAGNDGQYSVSLPALRYGDYLVKPAGPAVEALLHEIRAAEADTAVAETSGFVVEAPPSSEAGDHTCDWETAHRLTASSAGALIPPNALAAAIDVLTLTGARSTTEKVSHTPLWNRWALFFLILIFLTAEWAGRKYAGLI